MNATAADLRCYEDATSQIVQNVFQTMLETDTWPAEDSSARPGHPVVGAVYFAGSWKGAVLLECERQQTFILTAKLMSIEAPHEVDDDVRDAMGEVTNMIAGNLKSLLPSGTALSMPSVVEGSDFTLRVIGQNGSVRLALGSSHGMFSVTLVQVIED